MVENGIDGRSEEGGGNTLLLQQLIAVHCTCIHSIQLLVQNYPGIYKHIIILKGSVFVSACKHAHKVSPFACSSKGIPCCIQHCEASD